MNNQTSSELVNPLAHIIPTDTFQKLLELGIINEKSIRDYVIRKKFKLMRTKNVKAAEAIDNLRSEYPYLQFDTIRKIVYNSKAI